MSLMTTEVICYTCIYLCVSGPWYFMCAFYIDIHRWSSTRVRRVVL